MQKLGNLLTRLRRDESGAAMVEYTILLGIITVATIATIILVGTWVGGQWDGPQRCAAGAGSSAVRRQGSRGTPASMGGPSR